MVDTKEPLKTRSGAAFSSAARTFMLLGCGFTLLGHLYLTLQVDTPWTSTPIGALSQQGSPWVHAVVLAIFGCTQALLAYRVSYPHAGILTRCVQYLAVINGMLVISLGYVFTLQDNALHTTMLWIIASLAGVMMWCLMARRISADNNLGGTLVHGGFLLLWLALMPLYLIVDPSVEGAYQRTVGLVYLIWLCMLAVLGRKR